MNISLSTTRRHHACGLSRQRGYSLIELAIALAILSVIIVASLIGVQRILANNRANNTLRQVPVINAAITAATVNAATLDNINTARAAGLGAFPNWDGTNAINEFGGRYFVAEQNAAIGDTPTNQGYFLYITGVPQSMCPTIANGVAAIAKGVYIVNNITTQPGGSGAPASGPNVAIAKNGATSGATVSYTDIATGCSARTTSAIQLFISRTSF